MQQYNNGQNYNYGQNYGGAPQAPPSWGAVPMSANYGGYSQQSFPSPSAPQQSFPHSPSPYGPPQSSGEAYGAQPGDDRSQGQQMAAFEVEDPKAALRAAKEEKRKVKLKAERKKQKLEDKENAARICFFLGVWNAFMWAVPCFGNSWNWRMFHGFGIGGLTITTSLLAIHVELFCDKKGPHGYIENKVCMVFNPMNGTQSLHSAMDLACSHYNPEACNAMTTLYYTSFMLIFSYMVSALTSIMGGICTYYYWFAQPLAKIRKIALVCFAASPFAGILGFGLYSALCPDLGDLFRVWTAVVSSIDGGLGTFAIRPTGSPNIFTKCGWCWFLCWITMAFSIAGVLVFAAFFKKHPGEKEEEKAVRKEKRNMEREINALEERTADLEFSTGAYDEYGGYIAPTGDQAMPLQKAAYPPGGGLASNASTEYASSGYTPNSQGSYPPNSQGSYPPNSQGSYPPNFEGSYPQGSAAGWGYSPGGYSASPPAPGPGGYPGSPQYGQY